MKVNVVFDKSIWFYTVLHIYELCVETCLWAFNRFNLENQTQCVYTIVYYLVGS